MSGSTTELNLKTAVDSDDTADYLTLSLADSLRTVDALFNNVTGHNHSGAHQGGPLASGSIGADAIADGAITSAKIADNSITSSDILDGTIQTIDLAANAVTQQVTQFGAGNFPPSGFSTTSTTLVKNPDYHLSITTTGGPVLTIAIGSIAVAQNAIASFLIGMDNTTSPGPAARRQDSAAGVLTTTTVLGMWQPAAGAHTFDLYVSTSLGTLYWDVNGSIQFVAIEFKR